MGNLAGLDLTTLQALRAPSRDLTLLVDRIAAHLDAHDGYVAFSGGKDSTVALDLARRADPNVPVCFFDSGLEQLVDEAGPIPRPPANPTPATSGLSNPRARSSRAPWGSKAGLSSGDLSNASPLDADAGSTRFDRAPPDLSKPHPGGQAPASST